MIDMQYLNFAFGAEIRLLLRAVSVAVLVRAGVAVWRCVVGKSKGAE